VENQTRIEDEIKKAEQYESLKQILLRLLDDPQVQQKSSPSYGVGSEQGQGNKRPRRRKPNATTTLFSLSTDFCLLYEGESK
jgi:hypothetical protein